jgi:hypothetical protein
MNFIRSELSINQSGIINNERKAAADAFLQRARLRQSK